VGLKVLISLFNLLDFVLEKLSDRLGKDLCSKRQGCNQGVSMEAKIKQVCDCFPAINHIDI
jgi:hypothetical protein